MRALQFRSFGGIEALNPVDLPDPAVGDDTALIRVEAASINPSDVKNLSGAMHQTTLPRIPGRDYAGVVEQGPKEWLDAEVWGTGGDAGFTRDGTHAQKILVPIASLSRKPKNLTFAEAATVGVNFMAAWCGVVEAAGVRKGETLAIIGSGGGVGGAVAQIAKAIDARVIGVDRSPPRSDAPIRDHSDQLIIGAPDIAKAVRDATSGRGTDVVFDTVGGVMFENALACLAVRGRLVEITATGQRVVHFDLADFYHNESRLFGVDTLKRDLVASARILEALRPGFEAGAYRPAPIAETVPLARAKEGYKRVAEGADGRIVIAPQQP